MSINDNNQYNSPLQNNAPLEPSWNNQSEIPAGNVSSNNASSGNASAANVSDNCNCSANGSNNNYSGKAEQNCCSGHGSHGHHHGCCSDAKPKSKSGKGCLWCIIVVLLIALVISALINCVMATDKLFSDGLGGGIDTTKPTYKYKLIEGAKEKGTAKIVILPITGEISSASSERVGAFASPWKLREALDYLAEDDTVAAIILEVNSPGGGLTASDIMLHHLKNYKQKTKVPICAYFVDEACSGGYYVSMVADEIYACPTTMTGSIGVIMQLPEVSELMKKCGINMVTIASLNNEGKPSFKDIGSPFRSMKPAERAMLQSLITESWEGFVQVVAEGRKGKLTKDQVAKIADGRLFSAKQALAAKIIDGICYQDELYAKMRQKIKKSDANSAVVYLTRETTFMDSLNGFSLASMLRPLNQVPNLPQSELPKRSYSQPAQTELR